MPSTPAPSPDRPVTDVLAGDRRDIAVVLLGGTLTAAAGGTLMVVEVAVTGRAHPPLEVTP